VLADPHIGSFGVVAIGLQLLAKLVLLHALARSARAGWWRWPWWRASAAGMDAGAAPCTRAGQPVSPGLRGGIWRSGAWRRPARCPCAMADRGLAGGAVGWWVARRIGGISGDGHGAGIELTETALLLGLLCWR
jgi:adenosylcobinamide-GDP ribazoletransferase